MPDVSARDAKLIQYLNEAYGTEKRLETALQAHIAMTTRATYKKRLQQHLSETKRHARDVSKRIKQLGGSAEAPGDAVGAAGQVVANVGQRAVALAQGPLHALRGTGEAEKQLKNAKTEYASEAEEIATYSAIQALAEKVGDRETATLAKSILREENRMSSFLEKEITRLVGAVATDEIPAAERRPATRRRSTASRSTASRSTASRSTTSRPSASSTRAKRATGSGRAAGGSRASTSRSSSSRASGTTRRSTAGRSGRRSSS